MGLGDWTQIVSNAGTPALDIVTPMVGNGSLQMPPVSGGGGGKQLVAMYLTSLDKAFTKGRIRTLVRVDTRPTGSSQVLSGGIVCMMSALNATANCYVLGFGRYNGGSPATAADQYFYVAKLSSFLTETILGSVSSISDAADGDYYPIQLEWNVDVANLGGVRLTASKGTKNSTDFSTLATFTDVIDTSSPLTTTTGEGIYSLRASVSSMRYSFDETSIYELS